MATTTARAPQPGNEKGRLAGRPLSKIINNSVSGDTSSLLRLQRLSALGFAPLRASLLAEMIWPDGGNRHFGGAI